MNLVPATDPTLWLRAIEVTDIEVEVRPFVHDMFGLMAKHAGVGLAANQIGVLSRFFVCLLDGEHTVCINPIIAKAYGSNVSAPEGCLSFPGRTVYVVRSEFVDAKWTDLDGGLVEKTLHGRDSRVYQHECQHLAGSCVFSRPTR